jgi:uncharacterized membrane protein
MAAMHFGDGSRRCDRRTGTHRLPAMSSRSPAPEHIAHATPESAAAPTTSETGPAAVPAAFGGLLGRLTVPAAALGAMVGAYAVVFGLLTWAQQSNFGTYGFDMGLYDQGIWLLSRFREPFLTGRGLNFFAHHVNPVTLLFIPAYWLGAGPHSLYLVETVWMALGAIPVWLLARDRLDSSWLGVALGAAFLLSPSLEWINWFQFHPDALIVTPLLFAYWLATRRRWGWFAVAVGMTLACKEDAALAVAMLGLFLLLRGERRAGILTTAAGAGWFLIATDLIIPLAGGGSGPYYQQFFPGFGGSLGAVAGGLVLHPSRLVHLAIQPDRLSYYREVLAPVAFLPLAAPLVLAIGAPQVVVNVMSSHAPTHDARFQYTAIVLAAVFLATVEAIALLGRAPGGRRFLVGLVAASALATNVAWSPSPLGVRYHTGIWVQTQPRHAAIERAIRLVPGDAAVSASASLMPHLTHRVHVYELPNPWVAANWGIRGENLPDPATVDYLVVDTTALNDQRDLFERLAGPGKEFRVVYSHDGIVMARRVAAAG